MLRRNIAGRTWVFLGDCSPQANSLACHGGDGAWGRIRTTDTRIFNPLLYQLSYPGKGPPARGAASIKEGSREVQRGANGFASGYSSSSFAPAFPGSSASLKGITYPPLSQRCRSTSAQRDEQKGRSAGLMGLPQIVQPPLIALPRPTDRGAILVAE